MSDLLDRRSFVSRSLMAVPGILLACRVPSSRAGVRACRPGVATEDNIEGPYYRAGASFRGDLTSPGIPGSPLLVTGRVLSLDCRSPLRDAVLDVWQADGDGHYDNDGSLPALPLRLRGKVRVAENGAFSFRSVHPGRYLNGRTYRPSHIHAKVSAPGHLPLTTQLYFPDDPFNAADPFLRRSLIMDVSASSTGQIGNFDFVLSPV